MKDKGKKMTRTSPEKGWELAAPDPVESLVNDQRSLDIGESGQFAPGGYYNQLGVTAPRRIDLDEYTATRERDAEKKTYVTPKRKISHTSGDRRRLPSMPRRQGV